MITPEARTIAYTALHESWGQYGDPQKCLDGALDALEKAGYRIVKGELAASHAQLYALLNYAYSTGVITRADHPATYDEFGAALAEARKLLENGHD